MTVRSTATKVIMFIYRFCNVEADNSVTLLTAINAERRFHTCGKHDTMRSSYW